MEDLSLHILDIAENSLRADASYISIEITENIKKNSMEIKIIDNGKGMSEREIKNVLDPFYTTKKGKNTGMGVSLFAHSAREAGGECKITSSRCKGSTFTFTFERSHIDRRPMGDITKTLITLLAANPDVDFYFAHKINGRDIEITTKDIKRNLDGIAINNPTVLRSIRKGLDDFYQVPS